MPHATSSPPRSLLQLGGDLEDLEQALNRSAPRRPLGSGSCSALLKLLPGQRDLLVAHDTWAPYQTMLRIVKKYTLPFRVAPGGMWAGWGGGHTFSPLSPQILTPPTPFSPPSPGSAQIPGSIQVFSSYPGTIFSGDDFYILSSGLVGGTWLLRDPPVAPPNPAHPPVSPSPPRR